jgi:hypothetical protein
MDSSTSTGDEIRARREIQRGLWSFSCTFPLQSSYFVSHCRGPVHAAKGRPQVGIAHHVSFMRPYGLKDVGPVVASNVMTRFNWVDKVCHKLDYIGINYYGQVSGVFLGRPWLIGA